MKKFGKSKLTSVVALLLGALATTQVSADQPVHCLREKIYGTWDFHISKEVGEVDLFKSSEVCTHKLPNKIQLINKDFKFSFAQEDIMKVDLMDQYKAEASTDGG